MLQEIEGKEIWRHFNQKDMIMIYMLKLYCLIKYNYIFKRNAEIIAEFETGIS